MKTPLLPLVMAAVAALSVLPAAAEKADRDKPMNIESDALRYDDKKKSSSFTGRVVVTKGTIIMRGERLEVHQDEAGHQQGTISAAPGARAFFRQKRDGADEYIEGEGEVIDYDGRTDTVRFSRRAELRRYRGASLSDSVSGGVIVYDNNRDQFTVDGEPGRNASAPTTTTSGGRVRATLAPRSATPAPSTPVPGLRPSTQLGGERK